MARKHQELNFELNLVPFIDMLSTCICFLLISVAWVQIGTMKVKQSVGGQPAEGAKPAALWTFVQENGGVTFQLQDGPANLAKTFAKVEVAGKEGKMDMEALASQVQSIKAQVPALNMVLIQPKAKTAYEDIIGLMDMMRTQGLKDLGVSPL